MRPIRFAQQVTRKYGDDIARLLGLPAKQVSFGIDKGTDIAYTSGTQVMLNPSWFKGADRKDAAGAIVHELTHAYQSAPGDAYGAHSKSYEAYADSVRARLGLGVGGGYNSDLERKYTNLNDRQFARVGQELAAGTGGFNVKQPGPKAGRSPGSRRNTGANANSKAGAGVYAALAASQAQGYASQAAGLQSQYTKALMAIKQQRGQVLAQAATAKAGVRTDAIANMAGAEGGAIANGIVGSSADAINRAGVLEARGQGIAEANAAKGDALAQLRLAKFGAQTDLNTGLMDLQAQKAADLAELQVQRYQNELTAQANFDFQKRYQSILQRLLTARSGGRGGTGSAAAGAGRDVAPVSMADFNGMQDGVLTPGERALIEIKKGGYR